MECQSLLRKVNLSFSCSKIVLHVFSFHLIMCDSNSSQTSLSLGTIICVIYIWQNNRDVTGMTDGPLTSVALQPTIRTEECLMWNKRYASLLSCKTWKVGFLAVWYADSSCVVPFTVIWITDCGFLLFAVI